VGELVNLFLDNLQRKVSAKRYNITKTYLLDLCEYMGADTIAKVKKGGVARVENWLHSHDGWDGCKRSVVSRVKQVFKWGEDQGYFPSSPIKALKRPKDNTRIALLTTAQAEAILANSNKAFALAFKVLLATGCRPEEFCSVTAADCRTDEHGELYWWVEHKNEKYTRERRRIYLTEEMQAITRQQMKRNPSGAIFRNRVGSKWTPEYLNVIFRKVTAKPACVALGLGMHTLGKRRVNGKLVAFRKFEFVIYVTRHTFAHRLLTGYYKDAMDKPIILGSDEVAEYMGNSAREVQRTYGKLAKATKVLAKRLKGLALS